MSLDDELEIMEEPAQTEAELIDQETSSDDYLDDDDQIFDADAVEADYRHAYDSFISENNEDYNGWSEEEPLEELSRAEDSGILNSEGYHVVDQDDLKDEVIEMEVDEDDIEAYIVDEDDNEIGFIMLDEDGNEVEYYYANDEETPQESESEIAQQVADWDVERELEDERAVAEEEEYDLGITREGVAETTSNLNDIYHTGMETFTEFKEAIDDIRDGMPFTRKKR